jgi:hypothetical protein
MAVTPLLAFCLIASSFSPSLAETWKQEELNRSMHSPTLVSCEPTTLITLLSGRTPLTRAPRQKLLRRRTRGTPPQPEPANPPPQQSQGLPVEAC